MGFFDTEKGVEEYVKMAEGFDGTELIKILQKFLPENSSVLEIGMGPGKDLDMLSKTYAVTGSDNSQIFLDRYKKQNQNVDLLKLDAVTLSTDRTFDCIYSNKVLHHLKTDDLKISLKKQKEILNPNGILFHSFWKGDKTENMEGLLFVYYELYSLKELFEPDFEILELKIYTEDQKDDSIYAILRRK
ncbi:methyltransferase [Nitrosopumilus cobalaminigenes]|uniref:Methyltransferase n=1 Tax=Nitrosopumilus cobalaminigenes TaxID=1470066 RepID=A0A7D5QWZ3_9ARCH|nr:class I SAM-dependent methyltransferase [Nitrosopumilus cobalaminigenes]QLH02436.1 methyltransferase [Nitrosopumilus cobalaminigenes]